MPKKKLPKKLIKPAKLAPKPKAEPLPLPPPAPEVKTYEPLQSPRGMRDLLPADEPWWRWVRQEVETLTQSFGYGRIETPILEQKALFVRAVGNVTDLVQKEMYAFKDQGAEELCLRPENTAAVARAYINHGMLNLPQPVKLWYLGPMFRRDRPQAGRYRQFHQWGVEVLGDGHPVLDAEIISMAMALFRSLQIAVRLEINSIGCAQCRARYQTELEGFYTPKQELLCGNCKTRLKTNRLRLLDCKEPQCELLKEGVPQITDFLCEGCREHFMAVLEYLDELSIPYTLNSAIVRGLDYYNRTVFEIFPEISSQKLDVGAPEAEQSGEQSNGEEAKQLGAQSALGGGGRYDGLVEMLGGRPTPAVGLSLGLERVIALLHARGRTPPFSSGPSILIAQLGESARRQALSLWHELAPQVPTFAALSKDGLKAQLEIANRLQVRYVIIIGQKEILDKTAIIRDMEAGIQEVVDYQKVVSDVKKKLMVERPLQRKEGEP